MKITTRTTKAFIELKVEEVEETVFASDLSDIEAHIENLLQVAGELAFYTNKSLTDYIKEFEL